VNKNKVVATDVKPVSFVWGEDSIKVLPIPLPKQVSFIKEYVNYYFAEGDFVDNYFNAEWTLVLGIADNCTNIPIIEEDGENITLEYLVTSGLWEQIKSRVVNYEEFIKNLKDVLSKISEQKALEKSIGVTVDRIADQLFMFLDKVGKLDLSEEGIKKLLTELRKETDGFNDKFNMVPNKGGLIQ
jgi:hypothetical protein